MSKFFLFLLFLTVTSHAQEVKYPYPVHYCRMTVEGKAVQMAYMDANPGGQSTVLLLHGKNFNGYYWKNVIPVLAAKGYRVIVPDQVGWGYSDKPDIHYSFHAMAAQTKYLLDSLNISTVSVVGHSMGGMLAARLTLLYPGLVSRLILENPIGWEDYRTFVPYRPVEEQYNSELKADFETLKKYQQGYYPEWKPEYEQYVTAQYAALQRPSFTEATWASALTYQMIYEQPVIYEMEKIPVPTLLLVGQADRTIVGKALLSGEEASKHGNYPALGRLIYKKIPRSTLVELRGIGHIAHIQDSAVFNRHLLAFLGKK